MAARKIFIAIAFALFVPSSASAQSAVQSFFKNILGGTQQAQYDEPMPKKYPNCTIDHLSPQEQRQYLYKLEKEIYDPSYPYNKDSNSDERKRIDRDCGGPIPRVYTATEEREATERWHASEEYAQEKKEEERRSKEDARFGAMMRERDEALLRLLEPFAEGDEPGSHKCNESEKQAYVNAKEIIHGGYNSEYTKDEIDGAQMTVGLIEHRCGKP